MRALHSSHVICPALGAAGDGSTSEGLFEPELLEVLADEPASPLVALPEELLSESLSVELESLLVDEKIMGGTCLRSLEGLLACGARISVRVHYGLTEKSQLRHSGQNYITTGQHTNHNKTDANQAPPRPTKHDCNKHPETLNPVPHFCTLLKDCIKFRSDRDPPEKSELLIKSNDCIRLDLPA